MSDGNYDNTNRGALFKNDRQRDGSKDPDYKGNVNADGMEYWLSAWINKDRNGKTYMSLSLQVKEDRQSQGNGRQDDRRDPPQQRQAATRPQAQSAGRRDYDDSIPF